MKNLLLPVGVFLLVVGGSLYIVSNKTTPPEESSYGDVSDDATMQNVEVKDGVQYVTITARGGYTPRITEIQGNTPTKLIVKTNSTYDCSAALVIRSIGFQKTLAPNGEEIIDLGTPKSGSKIQGVCSMGMYSFQLRVI